MHVMYALKILYGLATLKYCDNNRILHNIDIVCSSNKKVNSNVVVWINMPLNIFRINFKTVSLSVQMY